MALPQVSGWIMDYYTAHTVFTGGDGPLMLAIERSCAAGLIRYSYYEHNSFKRSVHTKGPFCHHQDCRCNLCMQIVEMAANLPIILNGKKANPSDSSASIVTAAAIFNGFGLITSKQGVFLTPYDLASHSGLTCLTPHQFAAFL